MKAQRPSVCTLDCPDTCSLTVTVEDDRIVAVRGSRANPYTAGVVCAKVARSYPEFVHGPRRLRTPLRRVGARADARFEPISWDEALSLVYTRFTSIAATHIAATSAQNLANLMAQTPTPEKTLNIKTYKSTSYWQRSHAISAKLSRNRN